MSETDDNLFRVRYDDCDAYGHLNNVAYARYVVEAGLRADAAAGYDPARCAAIGRRWHTRRLEIEYLRPVRYGETVRVVPCGAEVEAATLRRAYALHVEGADGPVARAQVEAIWLDDATQAAVPVPDDLRAALARNGALARVEPCGALPPLPTPPPGVFTIRHRVTWQDLDLTRRVPAVAILAWSETCGMAVVAAHGWPPARMVAEGFAIILRRNRLE